MRKTSVIILATAFLGLVSNSIFSAGALRVKTPNSGQKWTTGKKYTIQWNKGNAGTSVKIELLKSGKAYKVIKARTKNDGRYRWKIPSSVKTGSAYKIKITSKSDASFSDSSNKNFTITKVGSRKLQVIRPNGGQSWITGKTYTIRWKKGNGKVKIQLLKADVVSLTIAVATKNKGKYRWTIPSTVTTGSAYKIKITYATDTGVTDFSDGNFSVRNTRNSSVSHDQHFSSCSYSKPTLTCQGDQGGVLICGLSAKTNTVTCQIEGVYRVAFSSCSLFGRRITCPGDIGGTLTCRLIGRTISCNYNK